MQVSTVVTVNEAGLINQDVEQAAEARWQSDGHPPQRSEGPKLDRDVDVLGIPFLGRKKGGEVPNNKREQEPQDSGRARTERRSHSWRRMGRDKMMCMCVCVNESVFCRLRLMNCHSANCLAWPRLAWVEDLGRLGPWMVPTSENSEMDQAGLKVSASSQGTLGWPHAQRTSLPPPAAAIASHQISHRSSCIML